MLALHEYSLSVFGGATGLRDDSLLDSALARPKNLYAYEPESDIARLAASYAFGLGKNHAFVDGNKRVAFLSLGLFLGLNGYKLSAMQIDAYNIIIALASSQLDEAGLAEWVRGNMKAA